MSESVWDVALKSARNGLSQTAASTSFLYEPDLERENVLRARA